MLLNPNLQPDTMSRATHLTIAGDHSALLATGPVELYNVHLMVESVPPENAFTIMFCNATELSEATSNIIFKVNKVENQIQAGALSLSFDGVMFPKGLYIGVQGDAGDSIQAIIEYD